MSADVVTDTGPFVIVPEWLLDAGASAMAVKLYCTLGRFADRKDGSCHPSRSTLAKRMSCSIDTVDRALRELRDKGALSWEQRTVKASAELDTSVYTLHRVRVPSRTDAPTGSRTDAAPGSRTHAAENQNHLNQNQLNQSETPSLVVAPRALTDFDRFWAAYPAKVAKGAARKAWPKALKAAGDPERIIAGAERYAADPNREPGFTAHPSTWLNAERWDDDPLPPKVSTNRWPEAPDPPRREQLPPAWDLDEHGNAIPLEVGA